MDDEAPILDAIEPSIYDQPNTVERRVANLKNAGVDVEYRRYERAGHGFGLGAGTDAEGWLDLAVRFWERYISY